MSKHRAQRPRRLKARYGRMAVTGLAATVTGIALLAGAGVIPVSEGDASATGRAGSPSTEAALGLAAPRAKADPESTAADAAGQEAAGQGADEKPAQDGATRSEAPAVPAGAGSGRRVVFSEEQQRVWLVGSKGRVRASYLVSGSVIDNLHPGTYEVYSRSRWAVGIDDSGVMEYFVRFTRGQRAAIGFHSIPTKDGVALQSVDQLGTPQSHGCIRQRRADAVRMWDFAPLGTPVVVV